MIPCENIQLLQNEKEINSDFLQKVKPLWFYAYISLECCKQGTMLRGGANGLIYDGVQTLSKYFENNLWLEQYKIGLAHDHLFPIIQQKDLKVLSSFDDDSFQQLKIISNIDMEHLSHDVCSSRIFHTTLHSKYLLERVYNISMYILIGQGAVLNLHSCLHLDRRYILLNVNPCLPKFCLYTCRIIRHIHCTIIILSWVHLN